jgi:hypothetical protein
MSGGVRPLARHDQGEQAKLRSCIVGAFVILKSVTPSILKEASVTDQNELTPRIARIWRGRTARDRADEYLRYWREEGGLLPLAERALAVQMLREDRGNITEFATISWWPSIEAMADFTGGDPLQVHHLPRDPDFLLELPDRVQVLEVTDASWPEADAQS